MIKKYDFDDNIVEILDFAMEKKFLFGVLPPENINIKLTCNIPEDFTSLGPDGKKYEELEDSEFSYADLRSKELAEMYGIVSQDKSLQKLFNQIESIFLSSDYYDKVALYNPKVNGDLVESIVDDMLCCAQYRAIFGKRPGFWETIFQIYKSGGMPVGWSGKYPEGRFMAIYPGLKSK